jgi:hypothetical protein
VGTVLAGLRLGHALQQEWRAGRLDRLEDDEGAARPSDPIAEGLAPEGGECFGIEAVEDDVQLPLDRTVARGS